jgi:hypothetical protein
MNPPPPPRKDLTEADTQRIDQFVQSTTKNAINRWLDAVELASPIDEMTAHPQLDRPLERWKRLAFMSARQAEEMLITTILTHDDEFDADMSPEEVVRTAFKPRGVVIEGVVFLAVRHPDFTPHEEPSGMQTMILTTLPMASIKIYD